MPLRAILAAAVLLAAAPCALAHPGDPNEPIPLKMLRGSDTVTVRGVLTQNSDCCNYVFKAKAGQRLYWTQSGPSVRMGIRYPDGDGIDPGLPSPTTLPQTGAYILSISPDLMAEGAFGHFRLTIRIPPPH